MLARLLHYLVIQQNLRAWMDFINSSSEISVPSAPISGFLLYESGQGGGVCRSKRKWLDACG
jgi:hypothetical protein